MVDRGVAGDELIIDWDEILDNLPDDLCFDLGDLPPAEGLSTSPDSGCSLSIDDIEQYLFNDDSYQPVEEEIVFADEFAADCFAEPESSDSDPDRVKDSSASPKVVEVVNCEEERERENPQEDGADAMQTGENCAADDDDGNANDPDEKKRKRQMRNRDAAVRSRERKKMLVRDLEMKSKYYEAECKRLGNLLQCCLAENQALRFSLHNSQAFDASRTKQESAVLLLESLLLGSLLGFLGIIYLLILPSQLLSALEVSLLQNVDNTEHRSVAARREAGNEDHRSLFHSFMMGKRCKASRSRMKLRLLSRGDTAGIVSGFLLVGHRLVL